MRYEHIPFDKFEEYYIKKPDGYLTVYSHFDEDEDGLPLKTVNLDMICQWRLHDGKVRFLSIPFETEEQFNKIRDYLRVTTDILYKDVSKDVDKLATLSKELFTKASERSEDN